MKPATETDAEQREEAEINSDLALLKAILAEPSGTQQAWAVTIGKSKGLVNRKLQKLKAEKLVDAILGKWSLTERGRKAAT